MKEIRAQRWYNNKPPYGLRGFLDDRANRIIGYPILRQIRVGRFHCEVEYPLNNTIKECTGTRGTSIEDTNDYCTSWTSEETFAGSCDYPEFKYENSDTLQTFSSTGRLGTYGGGGYVIRLKGAQAKILERLETLQSLHWIDKRTRAVLLEFSVYNANVNLFATCTVMLEIVEGGGVTPKWIFKPVQLIRVTNTFSDQIVFLAELLFVMSTVFFTLNELWEMKKQKCSYLGQYWNIAEVIILSISYCEIFLYIYTSLLAQDAARQFNLTKGNEYLRMDYPILVDDFYLNFLAIIMFFSIIKLIKLLQFNKRMGVLALTIKLCWDELAYFFVAFIVIFFAFSCLFYFLFMGKLWEFSYLISAILTSFKMMLGKFDFESMKVANALSPVLFFVFSVCNSMVLVNIMLSIILSAFNAVKSDLAKKHNKYDIIEFMWGQFKKSLVQQPNPVNQVKPDTSKRKQSQAFSNEPEDSKDDKLPDKVNFIDTIFSYA